MTSLKESIETYIQAKDGNRPHLMADAFTDDAELAMDLKTNEISFPSGATGIDDISRILVSQFARQYENVYTFCMGMPPRDGEEFNCYWLVCMTEKDTGAARVGLGKYHWQGDGETGKISKLSITIDEMNTLPSEWGPSILRWARSLPYPWCPTDMPAKNAPTFAPVQKVAEALKRLG